ncbi:MAG: UbiH/UbiF/VisC/COQ6 family ubiquinone biosynthesis hydroxylase [Gammaproteobacteria bacterium]|nr:UbiH/UbiF/VisC/COQ6 family ubiquinone biosynthesis hydroxylase [Gammaproteobacteria bacterium]
MKSYDIIIIGSGIVGLSLAALLAKNNFSVALIESKKPELSWNENDLTARVSAIHNTSKKLFDYLEVWDLLTQKSYALLREMEIWDHTQNANLHFNSCDVNESQMGWIIENREIVKVLWEKLQKNPCIDFYCPNKPLKFESNILTLDDGSQLKTNLMIGADGANSWVRSQMPITLQTRSYQQKAIIAVIESQYPHDNIAYQKFLTTGPVALLPLFQANHTALVWSADDDVSDDLMKKTQDYFSRALADSTDFKLGKLKIISERSQFSLTMQHAEDYVSTGFALLGDAAHTIHPLAGLGVNLGLMDAACLTQILTEARDNKKSLGDLKILRRYARWRKSENTPVIAAMRALKEIFSVNTPSFNFIRSLGVNTLNQCSPIKNQLMPIAMGQSKDLPVFLQN